VVAFGPETRKNFVRGPPLAPWEAATSWSFYELVRCAGAQDPLELRMPPRPRTNPFDTAICTPVFTWRRERLSNYWVWYVEAAFRQRKRMICQS